MRSHHTRRDEVQVRMELKYCEHCGGLWVREGGAGVYCDRCAPKVADLPTPRAIPKRAKKVTLPSGRETMVRDYAFDGPESSDVEAAGGVA